MPDIFIRHCKLHIVRHGGWSWGQDPEKLAQNAVSRMAELLERKLSEYWSDDEDFEITAPVRIRVPMRLHELLGTTSGFNGDYRSSISPLDERLERAIDAAFTPFITPFESPSAFLDLDEDLPEPYATSEQARLVFNKIPKYSIQRLLLSWHERGLLAACLVDFSQQALEAWHRHLLENSREISKGTISQTPDEFPNQIRVIVEEAKEQVFSVRGEYSNRQSDRAVQLLLRLFATVEAAARFKIEPDHPMLLKALDQLLPFIDLHHSALLKTSNQAFSSSGLSKDISSPPLPLSAPAQTSESVQFYRPWQGEFSIASALPYLLLGPLSRIGYLEVLAACLEAAELSLAAPLFAQALAYKVLAPPVRGWWRQPADVTTATIFAGQSNPIDMSDLTDFARRISPYLSPLNTVLKESLILGHDPYQPLLLQRLDVAGGEGVLLIDVEGIFPIAWATDLEGLIPTLARFGDTPILVPQASIKMTPLDQLDNAGCCFITDAPPTCHETWRALRQPPNHRFWTNDRTNLESKLIALAVPFTEIVEEANMLWQKLAVQRPSVPLASDQSLERSLTLAAAASLGTISWMLWRERGPTAPYLALDRFHDLDARLSVDQDTVRVRLPLGRRYQDLYEHGFLFDVPDVPWLGGRILQFSGG